MCSFDNECNYVEPPRGTKEVTQWCRSNHTVKQYAATQRRCFWTIFSLRLKIKGIYLSLNTILLFFYGTFHFHQDLYDDLKSDITENIAFIL